MRKLNKKGGFTLAELLIVVAIIAVLVAIAIPVFSNQLEKAKLATDTANARSAVAEYVANRLGDGASVDDAGITSAVTGAITQGSTSTVSGGTVTISRGNNLQSSFKYSTGSGI